MSDQKEEDFEFEVPLRELHTQTLPLGLGHDFFNMKPAFRNFNIEKKTGWLGLYMEMTQISDNPVVNDIELKDLFNVYGLTPQAIVSLSEEQFDRYSNVLNVKDDMQYVLVAEIQKYHKLQKTKLWDAFEKEVPRFVNFNDEGMYTVVFHPATRNVAHYASLVTTPVHHNIALTEAQYNMYNAAVAEMYRIFVLPEGF